MSQNSVQYPILEKLSTVHGEKIVLLNFMEFLEGKGLCLANCEGHDLRTANVRDESPIHEYFEIEE